MPKPMQISHPEIHLGLSQGFIDWQFCDGDVHSEIIKISADIDHRGADFIFCELWEISRPTLYMALPNENLRIVCTKELAQDEKLSALLQSYIGTFLGTNQFLIQNRHLLNIAQKHDQILFYEFEHNDFHQAFEWAKAMCPARVQYRLGRLGYDRAKQEFDSSQDDVLGVQELLDLILKDRIKKLVVVNMYYPQVILNRRAHLPTILKYLGVELVMIDYDNYDTNYYAKAVYHYDGFQRFSIAETHQRPWDEILKLKNIQYIPQGFAKTHHRHFKKLNDGYGLAVASHARAKDLLHHLKPIVWILEKVGLENLYDGFQLWYFAFRNWIMQQPSLLVAEKAYIYRYLYLLYLHGLSLLKYETLSGIKTDRSLLLFGDPEWAEIFPQLYQGKYLKNYHEFFSQGNHINLLMNGSFSYCELNPVFPRALDLGMPFFCFPALVKSPDLEALSNLEYRNPADLSDKIERIEELSKRPDLLDAKAKIQTILHDGIESMVRKIVDQPPAAEGRSLYTAHSHLQIQLATKRYEEWMRRDPEFFISCFNVLLQGEPLNIDLGQCVFSDREYFQRLRALGERYGISSSD